jgi:arylsulfatase A-like enzyme
MSVRSHISLVTFLLVLGLILGGFAGYLESVLRPATADQTARSAVLIDVTLLYAVLWGGVGLAIGLVAWAAALIRGAHGGPAKRRIFYGSLLFALLALALAAAYWNARLRFPVLSAESLLFTAGLTFAGGLLWWLLVRLSWRALQSRARSRRAAPLLAGSALCLVALVAFTALLARESRPDRGDPVPPRKGGTSVLLLVVDALRADHLGCYGYPRPTSPNIDALAAQGALFVSAYAHGSRTKESTACLLTSEHPAAVNLFRHADILPEGHTTLMQEMKELGYRTAVVSANALVSPGLGFGRGVDAFFCLGSIPEGERTLLISGIQTVCRHAPGLSWLAGVVGRLVGLLPTRGNTRPLDKGSADSLNAALLSWLDEDPATDCFAYVHYMEPHVPYAPPPPYDQLFDPDYDGPRVTVHPYSPLLLLPFIEGQPLPEEQRRNMVAQYDGSIACFDAALGRLLERLRSRGLMEDTLIIITADHGEEFYEHRGWGHGQSLFDELIRVPLIVTCPEHVEPGSVIDATARHVDVVPTVLEAVGVERSLDAPAHEGRSLWPTITAGVDPGAELPVLAEVHRAGHHARALKVGDWKVIQTTFGDRQAVMLFDLSVDPSERDDLSDERPRLRDSMLARLRRMHEASLARKEEVRVQVFDEATRERLEALGYVE